MFAAVGHVYHLQAVVVVVVVADPCEAVPAPSDELFRRWMNVGYHDHAPHVVCAALGSLFAFFAWLLDVNTLLYRHRRYDKTRASSFSVLSPVTRSSWTYIEHVGQR
ncbi:predicted protein [Lichtheimia corymbifera JMRC:FSU:9682]|uniref:Uncharacterized protein n=1 Tax=Lichtheimia corymbifera JMRC:FSU:9682 TaxID=1263082 RepID=A0A068SEV0_9FUNG|nr:predicted protein [Lichtheimia corymbifera JMRC:FSU:9682]